MQRRCVLVALLLGAVCWTCEGNHIDPEVDMTPVSKAMKGAAVCMEYF